MEALRSELLPKLGKSAGRELQVGDGLSYSDHLQGSKT